MRRWTSRWGAADRDAPRRRRSPEWLGAQVFRVHEVAETRQVLDMVSTIAGDRRPDSPPGVSNDRSGPAPAPARRREVT